MFFVWPQPEQHQLRVLYKRETGCYTTAEQDLSQTSSLPARKLHKLLQAFGVNKGRFLDVGCATGQLMFNMRKLGWEVIGNDVNADSIEIAKNNGLTVFHGDLDDCSFDDGSFDVVYMGDVIEHLRYPNTTLTKIYSLLSKNGLLILNTPNSKCGYARTSLSLAQHTHFPWVSFLAPYHLYGFSPNNMKILLNNNNFDLVQLGYSKGNTFLRLLSNTGFFDELKLSMKISGKYKVNRKFLWSIPKFTLITSLIFPLYVFGVLHDWIMRIGPGMKIVAKKK